MISDAHSQIRMIPLRQINVVNPRHRGKKKFSSIVSNIEKLGLKKPVTVIEMPPKNGEPSFNLVCGQGRLEGYERLGATEIPAIVVEGSKEDGLLMSLAENIARKRPNPLEMVRQLSVLKDRGYTNAEISRKTDIPHEKVSGILKLLAKGESRLLGLVEQGLIPVSVAVTIATSDDAAIQRALTEAYESNDLRGKNLINARKLIEQRRAGMRRSRRAPETADVTPNELLRTYQKETLRQKLTIQRAKVCEARLLFATTALKQLLQDDHFVTLLRAEALDSFPQYLACRLELEAAENA